MIPPKPKGSLIEEFRTPNSYTLKWPMPSAGVREYLSALTLLCFVGYIVYQSVVLLQRPGPRGLRRMSLIYLLPLLLTVVPGLWLLRRSRPESLTLGEDSFRHDLGRASGYAGYSDAYRNRGLDRRTDWERLVGPPVVLEVPKEEVGKVVLERDRGLRLRYDLGADRVEVGRHLREPEKEWLAEV